MPEKLYRICPQCKGVGELTRRNFSSGSAEEITVVTCPNCLGKKVMLWGGIDLSDIIDKLDDINDKVNDIFEKVNE